MDKERAKKYKLAMKEIRRLSREKAQKCGYLLYMARVLGRNAARTYTNPMWYRLDREIYGDLASNAFRCRLEVREIEKKYNTAIERLKTEYNSL